MAIRSPLLHVEIYCCLKKKRIPTTSDRCHWSRNDRGFLYIALSFFNFHSLHHGNAFCTKRNFPCKSGVIQANAAEIVTYGKIVLNYKTIIATFLEYALDNCEILDAE